MTGLARRRDRIARIRYLEHRAAAARTAIAQAAVANLNRVSSRITALQSSLCAGVGATCGQSLNAQSEMGRRLSAAHAGLLQPLQQAEADVIARAADQRAAHQRNESAAKLHAQAIRTAEQDAARRADANRPFRKRANQLGGF